MFFLANVTLPRPIPYSFTVTSFTGSVELCVLCARGDRSPRAESHCTSRSYALTTSSGWPPAKYHYNVKSVRAGNMQVASLAASAHDIELAV